MERAQAGEIAHIRGGTAADCPCDKCRAVSRRRAKAKNDASIPGATKRGQQWTGTELEIALRPDLTVADAAKHLGRTLYAVGKVRSRAKREPKVAWLAGLNTVTADKARP